MATTSGWLARHRAASACLLIGVLLGVAAVVMLVGPGRDLVGGLTRPACATPCSRLMDLSKGTTVVFERVGDQVGGGGFTYSEMRVGTIGPRDVRVARPDGPPLEILPMPSGSSQTLNRNGALYRGVARIRVPQDGTYVVTVTGSSSTEVVLAPDIGQTFLHALPWIGLGGVGFLFLATGFVLLVVVKPARRHPLA